MLDKKIINRLPAGPRKDFAVVEGRGLFLRRQGESKRFIGRKRYAGTIIDIPLGRWMVDFNDPFEALKKWDEIIKFSKKHNQDPRKYFEQPTERESSKTLHDAINYFLKDHKKNVKLRTYENTRNRCIQIEKFYGKNILLNLFELDNGGRGRITEFLEHMNERKSPYQGHRCRRLLNKVFILAIEKEWMKENQNPARDKFSIELSGYTPKGNKYLEWNEIPDFLKAINESKGNLLTQLATKAHLLMCMRVGALVRLQWDWFDESKNQWIIPSQTSGLKRLKNEIGKEFDHVIPSTPEINAIMDKLRKINGHQPYVFFTYAGKKHPHMHEETINAFIEDIGYAGKQSAHGWRDVVATEGQEQLGADRDIISRQLGHMPQKYGVMGHYDNSLFLDKRRDFIERWNNLLVDAGLIL